MSKEKELSYFKDFLYYNSDDGNFYWLVSSKRAKAGDCAGTINSRGYRIITINGSLWRAHRLAWLFYYGNFPENEIDHINGNKIDNRIENLRDVTSRENQRNRSIHKNNSSGVSGVSFNKRLLKYSSYVRNFSGETIHLGYFLSFFDAVCARKSAEIYYGYHENHGRIKSEDFLCQSK